MLKGYNFDLAARFVSDYKLPVSVISDANVFEYELNLYEKEYQSLTKWNSLVENIEKYYDGDSDKWLKRYYDIRENIIQYIITSDEHKKFNTTSDYTIWNSVKIPKCVNPKTMYNHDNCKEGHNEFISIDMKKANFQAFQYVNVIKDKTYEDFIARFCENDFEKKYVSESKYTRVVWAGHKQVNPSRQITLEKYLMAKLYWEVIKPVYDTEVICFNADEVIIRVDSNDVDNQRFDALVNAVNSNGLIDVRIEKFALSGYEFFVNKTDGTAHKLSEFYKRSCDPEGIYKSIPLPFHKILHRLLRGEVPTEQDRIMTYEKKCNVLLMEDITIEKIK